MTAIGLAAAVLVALAVVALPFVLFHLADRRQERRAREEYTREYEAYKARRAQYEKEDEALEAKRKQLLTLSWRELREACEAKTGRPCECATKSQVAQRLLGPRRIMPLPPPRPAYP